MNGNDLHFCHVLGRCSFLPLAIVVQRRRDRWRGPQASGVVHFCGRTPGLVDIFDDRDGSGSRTWMNFGMLWLVFATLLGFLMGWHTYDPTALDSLASVGWSYDDGSSLADATLNFLTIALLYGLIGSGMVATARNGNGRLASEANASMVAVLLSAVLVATYILPFIFGFLDIDTDEGGVAILLYELGNARCGMLLIPVFINLLITAADRGEQALQTSVWFLLMGVAAYILSMLYMFFEAHRRHPNGVAR